MGTAEMGLLDLLDAAPAWMECMALAVHRRDPGLLALFSSCNKLQQLVLQQRSLRPKLSCKVQGAAQFGALTHVRALAMAEASHNNVHLSITDFIQFNRPIAPNSISYSMVAALGQAAFIHSQRTGQFQQPPAPYKLHCITVITLYSVDLDSLVPDFLVLGCPNLNELNLMYVTITGSAGPAQSTCTSLQTLSLDCCEALAPIQAAQHLPDLPSLTNLRIGDAEPASCFTEGGMLYAALGKYTQLTSLHLFEISDQSYGYLPWSLGTVFPQLYALILYNWSITCDEDMRQLLVAATGATSVELRSISGLETSFALAACRWKKLMLGTVYVNQLALLPLSSCTRLECYEAIQLRRKGSPAPTPEHITACAAAAQAAGGLRIDYNNGEIRITLYSDDLQDLTPAAAAAVSSLMQHITDYAHVEVCSPGTDTRAALSDALPVLTVLGQHLKCNWVELKVVPEGVSDVEKLQDLARQLMPHVDNPQLTKPLLWES